MLKGRELIIATKPFAKEDRKRSWFYFITTLLLWALAFYAATLSFNPFVRFGISVLVALLLVRLFTIYHDYLHKAILKGSKLAKVIFTFFGFYTLNAPSIWKRSHDYHHKHNSKLFTTSIGSYPIFTKAQFAELTSFQRKQYLFVRHPLTIVMGYFFAFWYGMSIRSFVKNPAKHWDSGVALLVHHGIGIALIVFAGWSTFWFAFMIPALISSFVGSYLFYAQHNFPGAVFAEKEQWRYADAALKSTSYMKMNRLMHWFTGNIGYHHVHHINALIPFYRLREAHRHFPEFDVVKRTSLNPIEMYKCLKMKVWDPDLNRMLALNEIKS